MIGEASAKAMTISPHEKTSTIQYGCRKWGTRARECFPKHSRMARTKKKTPDALTVALAYRLSPPGGAIPWPEVVDELHN